MTIPPPPPPGVYRSRSSTTRRRVLAVAAALALVLLGYLIGRLQGFGTPANGSTAAHPVSSAPASSAAPAPSSAAPAASSAAPPTPAGIDAYVPLQAEAAAAAQGTQTENTSDDGGGQDVGYVNNGDALRFDDIDFGATAATKVAARVASDSDNGGRMEIRLDTPASQPVATVQVTRTGGWQNWQTVTAVCTPVTGLHTVFVTFANDTGDEFMNLNYFTFEH
jgi:hypothetical protein